MKKVFETVRTIVQVCWMLRLELALVFAIAFAIWGWIKGESQFAALVAVVLIALELVAYIYKRFLDGEGAAVAAFYFGTFLAMLFPLAIKSVENYLGLQAQIIETHGG